MKSVGPGEKRQACDDVGRADWCVRAHLCVLTQGRPVLIQGSRTCATTDSGERARDVRRPTEVS